MKFSLNESLTDLSLSEGIFDAESKLKQLKELALERMNRIDRALTGAEDGLEALGDNDEDDDAATAALRKELEAKHENILRAKRNLEREMDELKARIERERSILGDDSVYSEIDDMDTASDDKDDKDDEDDKDIDAKKSKKDDTDKKDNSSENKQDSDEEDDEDEDEDKRATAPPPPAEGKGGQTDPKQIDEPGDPPPPPPMPPKEPPEGPEHPPEQPPEGPDQPPKEPPEGPDEPEEPEEPEEPQEPPEGPDQPPEEPPEGPDGPEGKKGNTKIRNPFADLKIQLPQHLIDPDEIKEPTLQELIQMLQQQHLTGDAKRGALDALKQIMADKITASGSAANESLQEALITDSTSILNMSSEDFSDMINDVINAAVKAKGAVKIAPKAKRIELTQELSDDPRMVWNEIKSDEQINQLVDPIHGNQAEIDRIMSVRRSNARNFGTFEKFKETLYEVINDQIQHVYQMQHTHRVPNKRLASSDKELKPGQIRKMQEQESIPKLQIYVDQSGSWGPQDLKYSRSILTELAEFREQGVLEMEVLYFADHVHGDPAPARAEDGTSAWPDILDNIINTKANNVVIITDNDLSDAGKWLKEDRYVKVTGGVWFIYKPRTREPDAWCPNHLHGEMFNGEFYIN